MKLKVVGKYMLATLAMSAAGMSFLFAQPGPSRGAAPPKVSTAPAKGPRVQTVSAAAIPAGTPVATVLKVEGELDILVSAESGLVRAEQGIVLKEGTRVITMAKTNVTIKFSDGCVIELKPNHRFEVSMAPPCEERIELAESTLIDVAELEAILESSTASIPAMALSGAFPGGVIAGTGLAGAGAIAAASAQDTASPN